MSKKRTFEISLNDNELDLLFKAKKTIDPDNLLPIEIYVEDVIHKCLQRHFSEKDDPQKSLYSLFLGEDVANNPLGELAKMFKDQKVDPSQLINFLEDMGHQYNLFEEFQTKEAKKDANKAPTTEQEKAPKTKQVTKKSS